MSDAQDHIGRLDQSLASKGENVTLRRTVGSGTALKNIDVVCRAFISGVSAEQIIGNITATDLNVIMSPSQIDAAQWPGGQPEQTGLNAIDPRIPVVNSDKVIARGRVCNVKFVDARIIGDALMRINLRIG